MNITIDVNHRILFGDSPVILPLLAELRALLMSNQDKIDALTAKLGTAADGLRADIQGLKDQVAAGQPLDFTALEAKVDALAALDDETP